MRVALPLLGSRPPLGMRDRLDHRWAGEHADPHASANADPHAAARDRRSTPSPSNEPAPSRTEQPEQPEQPEQTPTQPDVQVAECTQETFDATRQRIEGQQEAFATGDFASGADPSASQSFQSSVSVDQFREIIVGTYPFLIDSPELAFPECQRETDTVLMRVEVDGSPSIVLDLSARPRR